MPDSPLTAKTPQEYAALQQLFQTGQVPQGSVTAQVVPASPQVEPVTPVTEPNARGIVLPQEEGKKDFIYRGYTADDGSKVMVYSTDGKRKSPEDFDKAIDEYSETGKAPKGFTVLEPGMMNTIRKTFEQVNQPVQRILPQVGRAIGQSFMDNPLVAMLQKYGLISPETRESLVQGGGNVGSAIAGGVGSAVNTPEKLGTAAGMVAANAMMPGLSLLPEMASIGAGAMGGHIAGSLSTGGSVDPGQVLATGVMAAASQGVTGVLKLALGYGTSQRAQNQVAEQLMDLVKKAYPSAQGNYAQVLEGLASSPEGVSKLSQIGMKAIMDDVDTMSTALGTQVMQQLPRTLSKGAQNTFRAQLRTLTTSARDILDNIGDQKTSQAARDTFNGAVAKIGEVIENDLKNMSPQVVQRAQQNAYDTLVQYYQSLDKYKPGAVLLQALKRSGARDGFNVADFQKEIASYYAAFPGSMMEQAGIIAGRGSELVSGTDKPISGQLPIAKWLGLNNVPIVGKMLSPGLARLGTRYIGTVQGNLPTTTAAGDVAGVTAIRSFLDTPNRKER